MPFIPHFLLRDMVGWFLALGILAALAALFPWELGEKADPFGVPPEGIKPEWYFLFMFQVLKKLPAHILGLEGEVLGVVFFGLCGLVVLMVPFLDRGPRSRRTLNILVGISVFCFAVLTAWGYFDNLGPQVILGSSLLLGTLVLVLPLSDRRSRMRQMVQIAIGLSGLALLAGVAWEVFG